MQANLPPLVPNHRPEVNPVANAQPSRAARRMFMVGKIRSSSGLGQSVLNPSRSTALEGKNRVRDAWRRSHPWRESARAGAAVTRNYFNAGNLQEYGRASPSVFAGQPVSDVAVLMWRIQNNARNSGKSRGVSRRSLRQSRLEAVSGSGGWRCY